MRRTALVFSLLVLFCEFAFARTMHVSPQGVDDPGQSGEVAQPFQSIGYALSRAGAAAKSISGELEPVVIYLAGGARFEEPIRISSTTAGGSTVPLIITSDPNNHAILSPPRTLMKTAAPPSSAVSVYNRGNVTIENQTIDGGGASNNGINVYADNGVYSDITINNCEVRNWSGKGIKLGGWGGSAGFENVLIQNCSVHDNLLDGIEVYSQGDPDNRNVTIRNCVVYNNTGDPNKTDGHSGSGIILWGTVGGVIEYCTAYNNGKLCPTVGGPVGIWTFQANDIVIQYCEAYDNGTASAADGGGFDLDGGAIGCTIQYCYSHDNDGAGYLFAQYSGAREFRDCVVRHNISVNDGRKNGMGGIHFWSSGSSGGIQNCSVYNNTIYMSPATSGSPAAFVYQGGAVSGITVYNNIFYTNGSPVVSGSVGSGGFDLQNNCYYNAAGAANYTSGGFEDDPLLTNPGDHQIVGTDNLSSLSAYTVAANSPCVDAGKTISGLSGTDFYGNSVPDGQIDIGAHEQNGATPVVPHHVGAFLDHNGRLQPVSLNGRHLPTPRTNGVYAVPDRAIGSLRHR